MSDPKIKYDIEADVKGDASAEELARVLRQVSDVLEKDLRQDALAAADALQTLSEKQAALAGLAEASAKANALGTELQAAEGKVGQLGARLAETAERAEAFAATEVRARAAIEAKATELERAQVALRQLRLDNVGAARATDEFKQSSAALTAEAQRLSAELAIDRAGLRDMVKQTREAEREQRGLAAQYDKSVGALQKAGTAQEAASTALATSRQAAERLGLAADNLRQQEEALTKAVDEKRAAVDAAKASMERLRDSEARAAQVTQAFQAEVRKLGIDGARAPVALEAAFRQLGISGVKPAEAAIHQLQIALAQIRNAPDILPADKQAAIAAFNQKVAELRAEAGRAAAAAGQLGAASQGAGNALEAAAHKAVAWTTALVGLQQLKSLAGEVIDTGASFETLQVRLENLLGSTQAASQAFSMIKTLAASTPFEVAGLTESFVKLTAMGMQPTEAQMRSLADVAANLGGGTDTLAGVTLALGQAWAKGKLQGEELLQLAERGVPVWDALAKATGRTVPELQRMSEAGALGRDVIAKLIDELGRLNAGASDKLMNTYAGAVANAKDALAEFFDMVAKSGALDWLTAKVRELLAEFDRMKQTGELQAKAKELSDAFIGVASAAEQVARAMVDMAPAIKLAVEAALALKAVNMAGALLSMAGAAVQAGAGMTAVGTAGAVAAGGLEAAAVAGGQVAAVLRVLRSLTGIGLVLGAAELAQEFFRAKRAAEEGDAAVRKMMEEKPVNGPKKAAEAASEALEGTKDKSGDLVKAFDSLMEKGEQSGKALANIGKDFDLSSAPGIRDAAVVLDSLVAQGKITAAQFREAWQGALQGVNLAEFEVRARQALGGTGEDVQRLQQVLDAGLRESIRRAGGDFDVLSGGMGKAARSAITDVDFIIDHLDRLKAQGVATGAALVQSLGKAIDTADSQAAIDTLRTRIEAVRGQLGEKLADGLLDQAKQKADALRDALDAATPGINSVREAMKQLGITSDESLKKTAATAKEAYDTLTASGTASARELAEGFKKAAETAIAANNGMAPAWVAASAAMRGFEVEVDKAGKSTLRLKDATDKMTGAHDRAGRAARGYASELERLNEIREREIAAQEKANQLKEREIELYLKKWNMDSQHRSLDADGKVREETGMPTRKGIYDRAKQGGLSDADALAFADAFDTNRLRDTGSRGTPFINLQKLDDAIAEAVLAAVRKAGEQPGPAAARNGGQPDGLVQAGAPAPERGARSSAMRVVNLYIGTSTIPHTVPTNAQGEQNLAALSRAFIEELARGKSVATSRR